MKHLFSRHVVTISLLALRVNISVPWLTSFEYFSEIFTYRTADSLRIGKKSKIPPIQT